MDNTKIFKLTKLQKQYLSILIDDAINAKKVKLLDMTFNTKVPANYISSARNPQAVAEFKVSNGTLEKICDYLFIDSNLVTDKHYVNDAGLYQALEKKLKIIADKRKKKAEKKKIKLEDEKLKPSKQQQELHAKPKKETVDVPEPEKSNGHAESISDALTEKERLDNGKQIWQDSKTRDVYDNIREKYHREEEVKPEDMQVKKISDDKPTTDQTAADILGMARVQDKKADENLHKGVGEFLENLPEDTINADFIIEQLQVATRKVIEITIGEYCYKYTVTEKDDDTFNVMYKSPSNESTVIIVESKTHLNALATLLNKLSLFTK